MKRRDFLRLGATGAAGIALSGVALTGCDSYLNPEVHSQLSPGNLTSSASFEAALGAAYGEVALGGFGTQNRVMIMSEFSTDMFFETGGVLNRVARPMTQFTWTPQLGEFGFLFSRLYRAIRDANIILDNLDAAEISEERKALYQAEARFVRAQAYWDLYRWFGPVPLRRTTSTEEQPEELPRASEEEIQTFLEAEFSEIIPDLPAPGQEPAYGRATTGAARGWLTRFYLNTKQWQKAADAAQDIIDMNAYALYPDFWEMFKVENERNSEYIWYTTLSAQQPGNPLMLSSFPDNFFKHPRSGITWHDNWINPPAAYRVLDDFYYSFDSADARREPIVVDYINFAGEAINLLEAAENATRSFKYWPDPNAQGLWHGNDLPRIRYADILLSRAEALNEVNGPNAESISLVNQVRSRAQLGSVAAEDFASKKALREHIVVNERGWEFYMEGLRRDDLIRVGKYIEFARQREIVNGQPEPYRRLYPIPQGEIDANPVIEQNPGYV